jgi:membrane associated rhomboid family serine protease
MLLLLPLRVEGAEVARVPWVSIAIAGICAVLFAITWVAPDSPQGATRQEIHEVVDFWDKHPSLVLPDGFADRFLDKKAKAQFEVEREARLNRRDEGKYEAPSAEQLAEDQKMLDDLADRAVRAQEGSLLWRWALVPSRGLLQPGWLLHMFLHFGWLHLLGNLLFFYLTAPLLEDVWGRRWFLGFYLACGLAAALAQVAVTQGSMGMMVGASGAIAGCMGAFSRRMAGRDILMGYVFVFIFRFIRGTFTVPAWVWGLFWFGGEAWTYFRGNAGTVAVAAHLGGFMVGFAVAVWLEKSGYEARNLAPAIERLTTYAQHQGIDEARAALARNDRVTARAAYERVLLERPEDLEALGGAVWLQLEAGQVPEAMGRLEPHLSRLVRERKDEPAAQLLIDAGPLADYSILPIRTLRPLRASISRLGASFDHLAEPLDIALSAQKGPIGGRALLRQAERLLARGDVARVRALIEESRSRVDLAPDLRERIDDFSESLPASTTAGAAGQARISEPSKRRSRPRLEDPEAPGNTPAPPPEPVKPRSRSSLPAVNLDLPDAPPEIDLVSSFRPGVESWTPYQRPEERAAPAGFALAVPPEPAAPAAAPPAPAAPPPAAPAPAAASARPATPPDMPVASAPPLAAPRAVPQSGAFTAPAPIPAAAPPSGVFSAPPPAAAANAAPAPSAPPPAKPATASSSGAVRVLACRIEGIHDEAIELVSGSGKTRDLLWSEIVALGAGLLEIAEGRQLLVTDFVLAKASPDEPPSVLRIAGVEHGLSRHFPQLPARQAYTALLTLVLERSGAWPLQERSGLLRGELQSYPGITAYNAALYRALAPAPK